MAQYEIIPVRNGRTRQQFLELPYSLYRRNAYWVPPLRLQQKDLFNRERHPFHKHAAVECFLAVRDAEVAGRVAAIHDPNYNRFHEENAGFFGFLETIDNQQVASDLLAAVKAWLGERGARVIRGPMNPSTNYECGLLVDGFDSSPVVMMPYNPPYYATLLERDGWRKAKDLLAYTLATSDLATEKMQRVAEQTADRVSIRPLRMDQFPQEVETLWGVYNSAWSRNWGFVPMTRDEFFFMARDLKSVLEPELALIGEVDHQPVGFALALPDINLALKHAKGRLFPLGLAKILYHKRSIRSLRVIALGVVERYRTAGVAAGFYAELFRRAVALSYRCAEMSWVLEDNLLMSRSIQALGGKWYKTYRIYEWN